MIIILIDNNNDSGDNEYEWNAIPIYFQIVQIDFNSKKSRKIKISQIQLMMIFSKTYFEIMFVL